MRHEVSERAGRKNSKDSEDTSSTQVLDTLSMYAR